MLRTKKQTIKLKAILKEGNKHKKKYGDFIVSIKLIDDRALVIKYKEDIKEYVISLVATKKEGYVIIYNIYATDLKNGIQKALLDCKYKVAVI